ncbi:C-type lectin domain family 4 member E-like isoform X3 [Anarhichas minor]|uniref:C-type lectin domain family 4 member E-like isoform X3 n=1 Tax=Anarhichas minor TaxID=65739 RepID=UPI003F739CFE
MSVVYCIDDCVHWSSLCSGPRSSKLKSRSDGAVFLSLGLLSVFLLARLISFFVYYQASEDKLSSVSEERDLLNTSLTNLTEEMDRRQRWCNQKKTCPEGWRMFICSCYLLSTKTGSWEESRKDCRDKGAVLVIIDSLQEQKFISSIVTRHSWIGLSDRDEEGTWKWVDGTPLTEAYWGLDEPNNGGGDPRVGEEDCVEIVVGRNAERNWNDLRCDESRKWICENLA